MQLRIHIVNRTGRELGAIAANLRHFTFLKEKDIRRDLRTDF